MFGRTLMTLGLAMLLAAPAHAGFGLVLPDSPIVDDPEKTSLNLVICAIDPATGAGIPIERPQVFTALRYSGDNMDRSEHLSVLDEVVAYGARAWTTNISLPHPGVYQLVMQTKAGWVPEQDKFVQYVTKVQIPAYGSAEGWDKPANISCEISPLSRPFGLCSGMAFGGILERSRVLEVLLDAVLKGARSAVRLVASVLAAAYIINLGTGSQMLAVIVPGRAFLDSFKKADISPLVLSRTCEDAGTIGCPLVPWSVHAFYIAGVLGVSAFDFAPYAFLNWFVPIFSILCALTGFGIWRLNGTPVHGSRKA